MSFERSSKLRPVTLPSSRMIAAILLGALGCSEAPGPAEPPIEVPVGSASAQRKPAWKLASGPRLPIEAGFGLGPIRLGANVGTIERLMQLPCEIRSESLCRYVTRGVDFHLVNGETNWIHVQRAGRPAGRGFRGENLEFSFFNGAIPPDLRLGMTPRAIQEHLGQPQRVEYVPQPNPTTLIERHYYPGLIAEYDLYSNGKLILGGVRIVKKPFRQ
jgi:hypothetical protein